MGMGDYKTGPAGSIGLEIPSKIPTKGKGTTGLILPKLKKIGEKDILYPKLVSHSPGNVMQYIASQADTYGGYIESVWDCEDYAYLAAADVRRKFFGQPVGVLFGIGRYGGDNINGKGHAINILWFEEKDKDGKSSWFPRYYDATTKQEIQANQFEIVMALPIPIGCSDNSKEYRDFPPLTKFSPFINQGTIALDRAPYDFDARDDIKRKLDSWSAEEYGKKGLGNVETGLYIPSDIAFYWFAHIRNWYAHERNPHPNKKVPPVGVAFGQIQGKDFETLILWKSPTDFTYFHTLLGDEMDQLIKSGANKFNPRLVIV